MTEDTDDETGQALKGMDSLPAILKRYVREDNRWFQQELREWEEQFCQAQREEAQVQTHTSTNTEEPVPEEPQNLVQEPAQQQTNEVSEEPAPDSTPAPAQDSEGQILFSSKGQMFSMYLLQVYFQCLFPFQSPWPIQKLSARYHQSPVRMWEREVKRMSPVARHMVSQMNRSQIRVR